MNTLNLTAIPKELNVILALLRGEKQIPYEGIDWNNLNDLALHHRLFPVLYLKLKQQKESTVPSGVLQFFANQYKRNTFQMLRLSAVTEQLSKAFSEQKIPLLLLKGPALAHYLYGDISLRTSSDLDFLIPIQKLDRAEKLLKELGYEKDDYIKTVLNDWKWRHHHVTFIHPDQGTKVELHWRLNPGPSKEPAFKELWQRKSVSELTSYPVYLLGKEDLLLFLIMHGSRHGWSRLRWLADIQELIHQEIDWKQVNHLLVKYDCHRALGQGILLATNLFQFTINSNIQNFIRTASAKKLAQRAVFYFERMVNLHTDPVPEEVSHYHRQYLFAVMSLQQKLIFILSFLYPYPEDRDTLPLPKAIHFLYFPLRPFLWLYRKTRKPAVS
ncbi:Renal dipeptidase [Oceanobacillus piezotolerans]|uniref:Renal dipeptidase n=1 Tax=Oceanobacillus piezotolerans TaxID=2448030 RepID=A0A498DFJ5_9BACI|nr:nucleotidyltransferase family protein [Oceanobacillus piezotolerans]RLL42778.1 Renal dipeptidase [Oceanobacillus piezotolerans]